MRNVSDNEINEIFKSKPEDLDTTSIQSFSKGMEIHFKKLISDISEESLTRMLEMTNVKWRQMAIFNTGRSRHPDIYHVNCECDECNS
jgi:hypothetical protein